MVLDKMIYLELQKMPQCCSSGLTACTQWQHAAVYWMSCTAYLHRMRAPAPCVPAGFLHHVSCQCCMFLHRCHPKQIPTYSLQMANEVILTQRGETAECKSSQEKDSTWQLLRRLHKNSEPGFFRSLLTHHSCLWAHWSIKHSGRSGGGRLKKTHIQSLSSQWKFHSDSLCIALPWAFIHLTWGIPLLMHYSCADALRYHPLDIHLLQYVYTDNAHDTWAQSCRVVSYIHFFVF